MRRYVVALMVLAAGLYISPLPALAFVVVRGTASGTAQVTNTPWQEAPVVIAVTSFTKPANFNWRVIGTSNPAAVLTVSLYRNSTCTAAELDKTVTTTNSTNFNVLIVASS